MYLENKKGECFKKIAVSGILLLLVSGVLSATDGTRRFGLFIGSNNGGRDRAMLRYAVSDARSVSRVFTGMGGISEQDNVLLVEPTVAEINRQLDSLGRLSAQSRRNAQRTELIFYYSGHSDENGILLNKERYGYRELRDRVNAVQADMRIVILDSCSSGAITRVKGGVKTQPFLFDSSVNAEGYAFLTSSSADETSQESDSIRSSYFTHSILAGLRGAADSVGDGRVTLNELYRFAYTETLAKTETSIYGAQHPNYDIQISGSGDVVLTDIKEISASIIFPEDLTGRLSIRDGSDYLVAELTKISRKPLELGLEPGLYRIMLQQGDNFYRTELSLSVNQHVTLGMGNFSVFAGTMGNRVRGDDVAAREDPADSDSSLYTFFVNVVSESFKFPLAGLVNIAKGNFTLPQFGFVNWNTGNFSSLEAGFINTIGGSLHGAQLGFINTTAYDTRGVQWGFVNTTGRSLNGFQAGFINTTAGDFKGVQAGFVNTGLSFNGTQLGFVNTALRGGQGLQAGFVNISPQKLKGFQFGFFNYADSIEDGLPVGFISIVRHGGYQAIEYSFSEFYHFNVGLKFGVEKFYTSIYASYRIDETNHYNFAAGFGIGSIVPMGSAFFFNPELIHYSAPIHKNKQFLLSLVPSFGFKLGDHFSISAGPSVTWAHAYRNNTVESPFFSIYEHSIDERNSIVVGARAALRFIF